MKKLISILTVLAVILSCVATVLPTLVLADDGRALTNLYNEDNYKLHGNNKCTAEFDKDNKEIKVDGITKAMIDYTDEMTDFDASVTMQSNANGAIYAGFAFHLNRDDFKTTQFNTEGYSVIVKSNSETNNYKDVKIIIRYVTAGAIKNGEISVNYPNVYTGADTTRKLTLNLKVDEENFIINVVDTKTGKNIISDLTYPLDNRASKPDSGYYKSGNLALISNGVHTFTDFNVIDYGNQITIPKDESEPEIEPVNPLEEKYVIYGDVETVDNYSFVNSGIARGLLKGTENTTDFSADMIIKADNTGDVKAGIIFRVKSAGVSKDDMQGYALILQKVTSGAAAGNLRVFLYKYGANNGTNVYMGDFGFAEEKITIDANEEFGIHLNVVNNKAEAYFYGIDDTELKSELLSVNLNDSTGSAKEDPSIYYDKGSVGFYLATGSIKALDFKILPAEKIEEDTPSVPTGGTPAKDDKIGSAVRGGSKVVADVKESNIAAPTVKNLAEYASDFDNYTFYSSSASNKFVRTNDGISSVTAGAKRAMLDGVTVKGFHSTATMRIDSEGTLKSGIVFRVKNIDKGVDEDGTLGANDIEGYAAILYKTPGKTENYARVVLCIYKYGIKKGVYQYLGTVASKVSEIPLTGCEKNVTDAAGKMLTIDVNVIDDQLTAYFYNTNDPSLKSETLVTELDSETDLEKSTPSLKGVNYKSGAIGLTATDYVTFINFTVGEPIYPSNAVGDLSNLESYMTYGSGVKQEGEYITANSSGTKKLIVKNLTVTDFKASVDMTIDQNGNLKSGFFFRVNEVGNGADDQTGWAIIVTRNYATNGETNPNRIDIVLFKWGYSSGKLSYLGEVAREVYKSGTTFVDGKMAGEELTFVVEVKGAAIDATLYKKGDEKNKPATYSSNLKFAGSKEKGEVAYFESGGIGLYLGNSVSDPLNYNKVRNFHIDDGSGIVVKNTVAGKIAKLKGVLPITGEGAFVTVVAMVFVIALGALIGLYVYNKKERRYRRGESDL